MSFAFQLARTFHSAILAPLCRPRPQIQLGAGLLTTAIRNITDCVKDNRPKCSKENLTKTPCAQNRKAFDRTPIKPVPHRPMWENPECCMDPCKDIMPRFDDLYYKPSDKAKRSYQQTWVECPAMVCVPKLVCKFDKLELPPIERRTKKQTPKTACSEAHDSLLMACLKIGGNAKCVKITIPGCRPGRDPPRCKKARYKLDCKKICCPYPSYSECKKPVPKPRHPVECKCLGFVSICDIQHLLRKRGLAWPK